MCSFFFSVWLTGQITKGLQWTHWTRSKWRIKFVQSRRLSLPSARFNLEIVRGQQESFYDTVCSASSNMQRFLFFPAASILCRTVLHNRTALAELIQFAVAVWCITCERVSCPLAFTDWILHLCVQVILRGHNWSGLASTRICSSLSQVKAARSMALMDKHKQVKRQRLDRICEGKSARSWYLQRDVVLGPRALSKC